MVGDPQRIWLRPMGGELKLGVEIIQMIKDDILAYGDDGSMDGREHI